ncbi:MAG: MarR family transcriptional regulator [Eubacteriales bacterium]|nr:MarR family transcriptional regulator [Eubacteriales bacterium]
MDEVIQEAQAQLIEALGRQAAFWGFGKVTGEIYAVLYLSEKPTSLADLAETLGVTKGNISVAIRVLEQFGMVRRSMRPGDRRVFFEAEPDFWQIMRRVLEQRQKPEFDVSFRLVEESLRSAHEARSGKDRDFVLRRLNSLQDFYGELDQIVDTVLLIGPERLSRLVQVVARLQRIGNLRKGGDGDEGGRDRGDRVHR